MISYSGLLQKLNEKGLTKTALAKELGISSRTMAKIGRREKIADYVLEKMAVFFSCSADELWQTISDNRLLQTLRDEKNIRMPGGTFNLLDHTELNVDAWNNIRLDDRFWSDISDIAEVPIGSRAIAEESSWHLAGGNPDVLNIEDATVGAKTYQVVSLLPKNVTASFHGNMFEQAEALLGTAYGLRYGIIAIILISLVATILLFLFLVTAAGHRSGTDTIVLTFMDRIPLEIYSALALLAAVFPTILGIATLRGLDGGHLFLFGFLAAACVLCICWIALFSILTFAVRIKSETFLSNTLLFRFLRWIGRGTESFLEQTPLLMKVSSLILALTFVEGLTITMMVRGRFSGVVFWFAEKAVLLYLALRFAIQMKLLKEGGEHIAGGDLAYRVDTEHMTGEFRNHGENLNNISLGMSRAVDERIKSEHFKTELITNVSHDIKTPLTSIINYVDLLGKQDLGNPDAAEYLEVLDRQSGRLKKLIEDLIEASKASTGNLAVSLETLEAGVTMIQIIGEFDGKTREAGLELIITKPEKPVYILADSRHFWRVIDNLMNNICKYAQPSTRVYINLDGDEGDGLVTITFRNTSRYALNITSGELMERFVRGDSSRNTEGSGLGLSIAKSLMELMGGSLALYVDGDLFKVTLGFTAATAPDIL